MKQWTEIDGTWHLIDDTFVAGSGWSVSTECGLNRSWNGVSIDRLPGGGETACNDCLAPVAEPEPAPAPKKRAKRK